MKTLFMVLAVAVLVLSVPTVSYAGEEHAAVVIKDGSCTLRDGNGNFVTATQYHKVMTQGPNNTSTLKCSVKDVPNDTGKAVRWDFSTTGGGYCGIDLTAIGLGFIFTDNWEQTVSASGNATLTCKYKNP
jgi:hypothetical protein